MIALPPALARLLAIVDYLRRMFHRPRHGYRSRPRADQCRIAAPYVPEYSMLPVHLESDVDYLAGRRYVDTPAPGNYVPTDEWPLVSLDELLAPRPGELHVIGEDLLDLCDRRQAADPTLIGASA